MNDAFLPGPRRPATAGGGVAGGSACICATRKFDADERAPSGESGRDGAEFSSCASGGAESSLATLANRPNHLPLRRMPAAEDEEPSVGLSAPPSCRAASVRRLSAALCSSTAADAAGERARARVGEMTGLAGAAARAEDEAVGRSLDGGEGEAAKDMGRRRGGEAVSGGGEVGLET